jgi:hypothetical protein
MLLILRYQDELRARTYFDTIDTKVDDSAVKLAVDLVEQSREVRPEKMPNEYARAVHELVRPRSTAPPESRSRLRSVNSEVVNIMDAQKSMQAKGQTKSDTVRKRMGKPRQRVKPLLHRHGHGLRGARLISLHAQISSQPISVQGIERPPHFAPRLQRDEPSNTQNAEAGFNLLTTRRCVTDSSMFCMASQVP